MIFKTERYGHASVPLKVREAQLQKIPYMLIVGDKEVDTATVSVRPRSGENLQGQTLDQFRASVEQALADRT